MTKPPEFSSRPAEYADPNRYIELAGFAGEYRDLWWNRDFLELLARRWRLAERRDVLDMGCGAGHWGLTVLGLMPATAMYTGVDVEPHFFAGAQARAAARGHVDRCRFVSGRAEALPFADASFDVVTCQTVLIHVADASVAIAEMTRVLRPGGIVIACEPDNLAGNVAMLGTSPATSDEDVVAIVALLTTCMRGKRALGEGDERVGHRLPRLMADAGLTALRCHTNDRCMHLVPPYDDPQMRAALDQELAWAAQGMPIISWTEHDSRRLHEAGSGSATEFAIGWAAVQRWLTGFVREVEARRFSAGRGFVMYVASGEKPA
jgi:SAM-dependent methyltransferase